jgi:ribose transport system ATP-binding protein
MSRGSSVKALKATKITQRFGDYIALHDFDIEIGVGEVVALLGQNGSGKSTLVKILAGYNTPEPGGQLTVAGIPVPLPVPTGAYRDYGLSFVFQDLGLATELRVAENFFAGRRQHAGRRFLRPIHWAAEYREVRQIFANYEFEVDPRALVSELRPTERALIAIIRAAEEIRTFREQLNNPGSGVLVLDEPTVFLPEHEKVFLIDLVHKVARDGTGVLFVSHDMNVVRQIASRAVVLRDGEKVGDMVIQSVTDEELIERISGIKASSCALGAASTKLPTRLRGDVHTKESVVAGNDVGATMMEVGDGLVEDPIVSSSSVSTGAALGELRESKCGGSREDGDVGLRVEGLSSSHLHGLDLIIHKGEIVGVAGLLGSGSDEIPYALFGALHPVRGRVSVGNWSITAEQLTPRRARRAGMALVPADRKHRGVALSLSIQKNIMSLVMGDYFRHGVLSHGQLRDSATKRISRFNIRPPHPEADVSALSGGNQQKVLLAKWLEQLPSVLLLHEPTQGVDVGTRAEIYELSRLLKSRGMAILWVSTDFEELATICDTVLVCAEGRIVGKVNGPPYSRDQITSSVYLAEGQQRRGA